MCVKSGENLISLRNKHFHVTVSLSFEVMYKNMKKKISATFSERLCCRLGPFFINTSAKPFLIFTFYFKK